MPVKEISRKYPKPISSQSSLEITFNFFCSDWKCVFLWQFASLIPMKWGIASFCHSFAQIKNILLYDFFVNPFPNVFFSSIPYVYTPTNTNVQKTAKDLNVGWYCKVWLLKRIVCHDVTKKCLTTIKNIPIHWRTVFQMASLLWGCHVAISIIISKWVREWAS